MKLAHFAQACPDPESSVRGSNFFNTFFALMRGESSEIPLKAGHHRSASEIKWCFADGPMMVPTMNAGLVAL